MHSIRCSSEHVKGLTFEGSLVCKRVDSSLHTYLVALNEHLPLSDKFCQFSKFIHMFLRVLRKLLGNQISLFKTLSLDCLSVDFTSAYRIENLLWRQF